MSGAPQGSVTVREYRRQFMWCDHFELCVSAVARFFIGTPSSKLGRMAEALALHMLISNFHYEFGP